uniref:Zinc finger and BTB domain containing 5 n=1 Tax=Takifugu rubripes TaxID=31033 RepID=A0A3B5K8M0_TAKRU
MDFPGHFQLLFKQLNHQRLHAQLCDCVVMVGDQRFQAHRSILAACSSHFRALLSTSDGTDDAGPDAGGRRGPSVMKLDPEVVTPEAFSSLLDMIYTSSLSLRASNVMDVLLAASHLHLNTVVKACKLHLSRKHFPASAPKGWRSVHQHERTERVVASVTVEDTDEEEVEAEVSQSGELDDHRKDSVEQGASSALRHKRKSQEDKIGSTKRSCRVPQGGSPALTRSIIGTLEGAEEVLSPDCLKTLNPLWEGQGEEEREQKYEANKGESEEIQLPSQSDSSTGCWRHQEAKTVMIEVKKENLGSYPTDQGTMQTASPPAPPEEITGYLDAPLHDEKVATACTTDPDGSSFQKALCAGFQGDAQKEAGELGDESAESDERLDSLSELAFSCFLNPSVMGALDEEVSLATLTAAAAAAAISSPSVVFPVSSVPLQQFLPTQSSTFSDTLILQSTQNPLTGFLSGIRPGLALEAPLIQPSRAGKSSGTTSFRRIAPKVPPGSETGTDGSSAPAADRPSLTRASEDVLSKCKKAAAEDHVLLVEGEKKYACKMCCKTFMNLTDCKKHIRVHTGEKPYPCPKCGKRFSQSSHLYKHSKNTCLTWEEAHNLEGNIL